ncbi:phage/plasmid primase, P4 family [Enterococcus cecorum]|uniref:DNA primase family protein n=1 Tax=Enterococcus cecorum TaxID=44008 RepID=UPI0025A3DA8C|nr:DNA primase family protein [Enterococcus cecorum]MDM8182653.1 phage/plasmid primase, P4 family [Enterococcus cecorum]
MSIHIFRGLKANISSEDERNIIAFLKDYKPNKVAIAGLTNKEKDNIKNRQKYFISGVMSTKSRKSEAIKERDVLPIDMDEIKSGVTEEQLRELAEAMPASVALYPTISNSENELRYRLLIPLDKGVDEASYKTLVRYICEEYLADIIEKMDTSNTTWSQLMGLPILTEFNTLEKIVLTDKGNWDSEKLLEEARETVREQRETPTEANKEPDEAPTEPISYDEAIKLFKAWLPPMKSKLHDRNGLYLNVMFVLIYNYQEGIIDEETAEKCLQLVAMGNEEWASNNIKEFQKEKDKTIPRIRERFSKFFDPTHGDFNDLDFESDTTVIEKLKAIGDRMRGKGQGVKKLSARDCSVVLDECLTARILDDTDNAPVYIYQKEKGTYTSRKDDIEPLIHALEPSLSTTQRNEVINYLRLDALQKGVVPPVPKHLWLVKNGIFNTKTKKLEPFTHAYAFKTAIATAYPEEEPPLPNVNGWTPASFLSDIACKDRELEHLLLELINECLNTHGTRGRAFILVGNGANGKSTFLNLLINIVGRKNVEAMSIQQFRDSTALSSLQGKAIAIGDDVSGVHIPDSSNFNSIVTGGLVKVRELYKGQHSETFHCTIIQAVNVMPTIANKTEGTYRRLILIPFNADFRGGKGDSRIEEYLAREEVREWFLYQALQLEFDKFTIPKASQELLDSYREENDPVLVFKHEVVDELLKRINSRCFPQQLIYEIFKLFCNRNNYKTMTSYTFNKRFRGVMGTNWKTTSKRLKVKQIEELDEALKELGYENAYPEGWDEFIKSSKTKKVYTDNVELKII